MPVLTAFPRVKERLYKEDFIRLHLNPTGKRVLDNLAPGAIFLLKRLWGGLYRFFLKDQPLQAS